MLRVLGRDRVHWIAVAGLIAACNGMSGALFLSLRAQGIGGGILGAFGINPIFWFVLLAGAAIAFEPDDPAPMRRGDGIFIAAILLLALSPFVLAGSAGLLLASGWLLKTSERGSRGRRTGLVLLALTTSMIWGPLVLALLGDWLVALDAQFVGWLAGTSARGGLVDFTTSGNPLMIGYPCSSMHNITMAIQLWVAITQQLRLQIDFRVLMIGLAAIVANVFVNGARIAMIASNREEFNYWHDGVGGSMFAWLAVVMVAMIIVMGCRALAPRRI